MDDFLVRALLAGLLVAATAGPLGCFVVWQRLAYFGEALSHTALLGAALGLLLGTDPRLGVVAAAAALALLVARRRAWLGNDALLGVLAHSALALGLVVVAVAAPLSPPVMGPVMGYLFGDILAVGRADLMIIGAAALAVAVALATQWRALLLATIDPDLAAARGVSVGRARATLMLSLSLVVAAAMQVVGLLLVVSMLLLPAACARRFARTPEGMAACAAAAGMAAVALGLQASLRYDWPAGPAIVVAAAALCAAAVALRRRVPGEPRR